MKGLILKDIYVLAKLNRVFLVLLLIMAFVPSRFMQGFAIMYASMLPITAISSDEHARWDQYAAMMPYSRKDLVISKYIIGISATIIVALLNLVGNAARGIINGQDVISDDTIITILIVAATAIILMCFNLPIIFKMGAERGRLIFMSITVIFACLMMYVVQEGGMFWSMDTQIFQIAVPIAVVVLLIASMTLSTKIYNSKRY